MSDSSIVIIQGTVGLYTVATRCHTCFAVTLKYTEDSSLTILRHSLMKLWKDSKHGYVSPWRASFSGFTTHTERLVFVFHGVVASQCERVQDVQPYHGSCYQRRNLVPRPVNHQLTIPNARNHISVVILMRPCFSVHIRCVHRVPVYVCPPHTQT